MLRRSLPHRLMVYDLAKRENSDWIRSSLRKRLSEILEKKTEPAGRRVLDVKHDLAEPIAKELLVRILGFRGKMDTPVVRANLLKWAHCSGDTGGRFDLRWNSNAYMEGVNFFMGVLREIKKCLATGIDSPDYDLERGMMAKIVREGRIATIRDMANQCMMVALGGSHNPSNLICLATGILLQHPEQLKELRKRVRQNPACHEKLLHQTSLEVLRVIPPAQFVVRFAVEDAVIGNKHVQKGDAVLIYLEKANHILGGGKEFNIFKESHKSVAEKHLAFGFGPHRCLGGETGQRVAEIALELLFFSDLLPNQNMGNCFDPATIQLKKFEWKEYSSFKEILEITIFV